MRTGLWGLCVAVLLSSSCAQDALTSTPGADGGVRDITVEPTHDLHGPVDMTAGSDTPVQFVVNAMALPRSRFQYSVDLDGDGNPDNAISNIIQVLMAQGLNPQSSVSQAIDSGQSIVLLDVRSSDPTLQEATGATVEYFVGASVTPPPDFSGHGSFANDRTVPSAHFKASIAGGVLDSESPVNTSAPVTLTLKLALIPGAPPVSLPVNGAHLTFKSAGGRIDSTCTVAGTPGQPCGALQGSIRATDLQNNILPQMAAALTAQIQANPNGVAAQTLEALFDLGGCTDANGMVAKAQDLVVTACELGSAPLIQHLLAPDVQIFDANGNYKPVPKGSQKDSISVGIGFTAVPATIQLTP